MKTVVCGLFFVAAVFSLRSDIETATKFIQFELVPDVLVMAPPKPLKVEYKRHHRTVTVNLGDEVAPRDVREPPTITYRADPHAFYTLIMIDPDAPSRRKHPWREFTHWLVVNIPGSDVCKGQVLNEYIGSGPPKDSGFHRYTFLLYKQPKRIHFDEVYRPFSDINRARFSARRFAEKYHLGNPLAGNFYQARWDDSVPELHKQLNFNP